MAGSVGAEDFKEALLFLGTAGVVVPARNNNKNTGAGAISEDAVVCTLGVCNCLCWRREMMMRAAGPYRNARVRRGQGRGIAFCRGWLHACPRACVRA